MRGPSVLLCLLALQHVSPGCSTAVAQVLGDSAIHDPSRIIKEGDRYYVYGTALGGNDGIFAKWSPDLVTWHDPGNNAVRHAIFRNAPAWVATEVPNNDGTFWAPTIIEYQDEYRLYYSVSTFGTQESAIGLATNATLDFTSAEYAWVDQGLVIDSEIGYPYNTIDPSVFVDADDRMWMTFGSYWRGIHITELDPADGKPFDASPAGATRIATRSVGTDIEAPYIHYRDGYYYLFTNWGSCCSGVDSTYEIRVGRGTSPTGPFVDNRSPAPVDLRNGGGTLFLEAEGHRIGPGHAGIYSEDGVDYFGYHFYDANADGAPRYEIDTLLWTTDDWPILLSQVLTADLNQDLELDSQDWTIFSNNNLVDLSSFTPEQQALRGDLDSDGDNDFADFRLFQTYYDALHSAGALSLAVSLPVPEPSSFVLGTTLLAIFGLAHRRMRRGAISR
jgi:arabinan endo-1,5-alpha-L-arabinosidase